MKTIYLIKTGENENGSPAWLELTGKEFFRFVHSDACGKRRFIEIEPEFGDEDRIVMEATEKQLSDWAKERNRAAYLKRWKAKRRYRVVSFSDLFGEHDGDLEDRLADPEVDVETEVLDAIHQNNLRAAIQRLPETEKRLIEQLLLCHMEIGIRELSRKLGLPYSTVHDRVNDAMEHLKKMLQEY